MSYDLVVFDPETAPREPSAFSTWYEQQSEENQDAEELQCDKLRSFFFALNPEFPAMNGPHAGEDFDNPKLTEYSFGPHSIYMCFAWSQAEDAREAVVSLAQKTLVGFYDISGSQGATWQPSRPGQFSVFYCFNATNEEVPSNSSVSLDIENVVSQLLPKMTSESDFLGIVDSEGTTVQFMLHRSENRVWMEIPTPEEKGSYGTNLSPDDLPSTIKSLPTRFCVEDFPEFRFQSWEVSEPPSAKPLWKLW